MKKHLGSLLCALVLVAPSSVWAADTYRWLRVTIDTPWAIFIFLLPMVLIPVVLMAILYWRFAFRPNTEAGLDRSRRGAEPDMVETSAPPAASVREENK